MDISTLKMALTFKGVSGVGVRIDAEAEVLSVQYVQHGQRKAKAYSFQDIEAWCAANLPPMLEAVPSHPDAG